MTTDEDLTLLPDRQAPRGPRRPPPVVAEYFVTGPYARTASWSTALRIGSAHAKSVGTIVTVCGLAATSWRTLWEVRFEPAKLQGACPACRAHLSAGVDTPLIWRQTVDDPTELEVALEARNIARPTSRMGSPSGVGEAVWPLGSDRAATIDGGLAAGCV